MQKNVNILNVNKLIDLISSLESSSEDSIKFRFILFMLILSIIQELILRSKIFFAKFWILFFIKNSINRISYI